MLIKLHGSKDKNINDHFSFFLFQIEKDCMTETIKTKMIVLQESRKKSIDSPHSII